MNKLLWIAFTLLLSLPVSGQGYTNLYEKNQTLSYSQLVNAYKILDEKSDQMKLLSYGASDGGNPLQILVINKDKNFSPPAKNRKSETIILIMNGIHPGESEGIDASLLFAQQLAIGKIEIPAHTTICILPIYNIDGMLNRKRFTRTNQNGPEEKGFRGSACNYDLNRDFLKADSKNTFAFYQIFHQWDPDVFIDNHTSNGADYQYIMTLISTQQQKLGGNSAAYLFNTMNPFLYSDMDKKGFDMVPYVNIWGKSPDEEGYEVFIETPKYSTGYTALFGTLSFVAETHMLKPYPQRVVATFELMKTILEFTKNHGNEIRVARLSDQNTYRNDRIYESNFVVDKEKSVKLAFKGFEAEKIPSKLGSYNRTYYNRSRPYTKEINYYNTCKADLKIELPKAYVIPQAWAQVITRLKANNIELKRLNQDTSIACIAYYIMNTESGNRPYEGHHVNAKTQIETRKQTIVFHKGDYLAFTNQTGNRYLAEVLEPQTEDGFFSWNFFDPILNQKEGFSDYVFEDDAVELLAKDSLLQTKFTNWKLANPEKAKSSYDVLNFIFLNSPHYEAEHKRFPIFKIE